MSLQSLIKGAGGNSGLNVVSTHALADLGTYFTANNGATGVATTATPTAYSDTAPLFSLYNSASSATNLYLDWMRVYETAAGTAGLDMRCRLVLDQQVPSAGTVLTPKNVSTASNNTANGVPRILPTGVAQTANSRVIVGNHQVIPTQTAALSALTEVNFNFGGLEGVGFTQIGTAGAGLTRTFVQWPSVVISPGWSAIVGFLITSQSAASSWAVELGWYEA